MSAPDDEVREAPADDPGRRSRAPRRWALFGGVAAAIVVADQLTKLFVDANFARASIHGPAAGLAEPTPVVGDLVRVAKTYNDGGIFGLFGASAPILALASLLVIGFILYYQSRQGTSGSALLTIALGLLLGGAIGNLIDRLRLGHVIDFVDMGVGTFRWYTFNVADAAISLSIVGLVAVSFLGGRGTRRASPAMERDQRGARPGEQTASSR